MVTRIFVEKKSGYDVEAKHMMTDLIENLGLKGIEDLRLFNRYDVSGLSDEEIQAFVCQNPEIAEQIVGKTVRKCIIVKGRLVNLIVG